MSAGRLLELGESLSERERALVHELGRLRLASHAQLAVLLSPRDTELSDASIARGTRRLLAKLTADGVLARLERRVGGVRAGSAGYVYYLGPVGQRLLAYWDGRGLTRGRFRPEPGGRYVRHRLAVSELYVQAWQAAQTGLLELLAFDTEPACWRQFTGAFGGQLVLKPDAFVRVGVGAYEETAFVEVDLASESRPIVARKLRAYVDYFHTGQEQSALGVFPRVLVLTTTDARRDALAEVCRRLPADVWHLFTVQTLDCWLSLLRAEHDDEAEAAALTGEGL